ncbi:MAG TPA: hypothetical protein VGA02_15325, partial [Gemmatimonadales bacterium]
MDEIDIVERRVPLPLRNGRLVFTVVGPEPRWLYPALHSLQRVMHLPEGWDSYGGKIIDDDVVARAAEVLVTLPLPAEAPAPSVVPGSAGSLQLEWHEAGVDVEIHISAIGQVSVFLSESESGPEFEFETLDSDARVRLGEVLVGLHGGVG